MLCFPRGDALAKSLSVYAGFFHCKIGSGNQQHPTVPTLIFSECCAFTEALGLERTTLNYSFLSKASFASGKKSCGRAGASWALLSRAPSSRPGFTLLSRTEQTQSQPCSSLRFSMGLFLRVSFIAPGGKPKSALGTGGQGDAVPLGPEAQDRPAFCPVSFLRVELTPSPSRPLMSP